MLLLVLLLVPLLVLLLVLLLVPSADSWYECGQAGSRTVTFAPPGAAGAVRCARAPNLAAELHPSTTTIQKALRTLGVELADRARRELSSDGSITSLEVE